MCFRCLSDTRILRSKHTSQRGLSATIQQEIGGFQFQGLPPAGWMVYNGKSYESRWWLGVLLFETTNLDLGFHRTRHRLNPSLLDAAPTASCFMQGEAPAATQADVQPSTTKENNALSLCIMCVEQYNKPPMTGNGLYQLWWFGGRCIIVTPALWNIPKMTKYQGETPLFVAVYMLHIGCSPCWCCRSRQNCCGTTIGAPQCNHAIWPNAG